MKNYNFNETVAQYAALDLDEMMMIDGGGFAYDLGHLVGEVAKGVIIGVIVAAL